jgi:hypothetical protein
MRLPANQKTEELLVDLKDESNPRSLISLLPTSMKNALKCIPDECLLMGDEELKRLGKIGVTEERLRTSFWIEYANASATLRTIHPTNVYGPVCRKEQFYHDILSSSRKMAYIFTPPPDYKIEMEDILRLGTEQMRDILSRDHVLKDENGDDRGIDTRLVAAKIKIWESVQERVKGSVTQNIKMDSRSLNVNLDANGEKPASLGDIDAQIAQLEAEKMKQLSTTRNVIDVEEEEGRRREKTVSEVRK